MFDWYEWPVMIYKADQVWYKHKTYENIGSQKVYFFPGGFCYDCRDDFRLCRVEVVNPASRQ